METVYATRFDMSIGTLRNSVFVFCMIFLTDYSFLELRSIFCEAGTELNC
jgi:hypothetical protein